MTAVFFVMGFDIAPIVIWIFELPLDQEIRAVSGNCSPPLGVEPGKVSHASCSGSRRACGLARRDRAVRLRGLGKRRHTHFVGGDIRAHRFSLTDRDSPDSTLGCIRMIS